MAQRVRLRLRAAADIEKAADYYLSEGGQQLAIEFVDAVQRTITRISRSPSTGSPRFVTEVDISDVRSLRVPRFPYIVFYVAADEEIDVWRVLHEQRDIPHRLRRPEHA